MKIISSFIVILSLIFLAESCKVDRCKDTTCINNSVCEDGNCNCLPGFEGNTCETEIRAKYLANYTINTFCNSDTFTSLISIAASPDGVLKVLIGNLYNSGSILTGEINSDGHIDIPSQPIDSTTSVSGTISKEGNGSFTVNITGGGTDPCSFLLNF
jgi:hypothetical protein